MLRRTPKRGERNERNATGFDRPPRQQALCKRAAALCQLCSLCWQIGGKTAVYLGRLPWIIRRIAPSGSQRIALMSGCFEKVVPRQPESKSQNQVPSPESARLSSPPSKRSARLCSYPLPLCPDLPGFLEYIATPYSAGIDGMSHVRDYRTWPGLVSSRPFFFLRGCLSSDRASQALIAMQTGSMHASSPPPATCRRRLRRLSCLSVRRAYLESSWESS